MSTFIGPYLSCKGLFKLETNKIINTCSNPECFISKENLRCFEQNLFCHLCGSKLEDRSITENKQLNAQELLLGEDNFDDRLACVIGEYSNSDELFFITKKKYAEDCFFHSYEDNSVVEINNFNKEYIDNQKRLFKLIYKEEIDYLIQHLGIENVLVKWGLVNW